MLNHPRELGFTLGLKACIGKPSKITRHEPDALMEDVVYVALLSDHDDGRPLEKEHVLKIGQTKETLLERWRRTLGIFQRNKLRPNEENDRDKFLERASGREISVWVRKAGKIEVPYAKGLTQNLFSTRCAEEEFLDEYYQPNEYFRKEKHDERYGAEKGSRKDI